MSAKEIVIYDADCGFCEMMKTILEKLDWLDRFEYVPLQNELIFAKYPDLERSSCEEEIKLIRNNGKVLGGGDALLFIWFGLPLCFLMACIVWLPPLRQLNRWIYPQVAKRRYLISSACGLKPSVR